MKIVVLGASGMLGHELAGKLSARHEVHATVRSQVARDRLTSCGGDFRVVGGEIDAFRFLSVSALVEALRPDAVVNAIGIVKQLEQASDPVATIEVNSLFPHRLASLCASFEARLIHYSTDCVFSGARGKYTEDDVPDPPDLYGRTKWLGEVDRDGCLTLRTSMIGHELGTSHGLLEWFLGQEGGKVRGFRRAVFSGLTTGAHADVLDRILNDLPDLSGIRHLSAAPINKFDLLSIISAAYALDVHIDPEDGIVCDRDLVSRKLWDDLGAEPPSWEDMIKDMRTSEEGV